MNIEPAASPTVSLEKDTPALASGYADANGPQLRHGRVLLEQLALRPGEQVLDVGAGTGELARDAAARVAPQGSVLALEPLVERLALARQRAAGLPGLRFALGGSADLRSQPAEQLDVVYLNSVLHWVADQPQLLADCLRLLKPGGRLGFSVGRADRPHQQVGILQPLLENQPGSGLLAPPHRMHEQQIRQLFSNLGVVDVQIAHYTFVDHFSDLDHLLAWNTSSFFGHFRDTLSQPEHVELRQEAARRLEPLRDAAGIRLERYLLLAIARKPH